MRARSMFPVLFMLLPAVAGAADDVVANASRCMALGREIAGTTTVIGDTPDARSYAEALAQQAQEIRKLRREMTRMRCGNGSIVHTGAPADACAELNDTLAAMDNNRRAMLAQREDSMKVVRAVGRDESTIRDEMRVLRCGEIDYATIPASIDPQGAVAKPAALPKNEQQSIIEFKSNREVANRDTSPPIPEREWKPDSPVRTVGPQFFPDDNRIDLAHPSLPGSQPQQ